MVKYQERLLSPTPLQQFGPRVSLSSSGILILKYDPKTSNLTISLHSYDARK
jgi:hypothetical protein